MFGLILPFLVLFIGIVWLAFAGAPLPMAFWVPTLAGIVVALILAKNVRQCADAMIKGMASEMVAIMLMAWFLGAAPGYVLCHNYTGWGREYMDDQAYEVEEKAIAQPQKPLSL